jgi:hypothetical protein
MSHTVLAARLGLTRLDIGNKATDGTVFELRLASQDGSSGGIWLFDRIDTIDINGVDCVMYLVICSDV